MRTRTTEPFILTFALAVSRCTDHNFKPIATAIVTMSRASDGRSNKVYCRHKNPLTAHKEAVAKSRKKKKTGEHSVSEKKNGGTRKD